MREAALFTYPSLDGRTVPPAFVTAFMSELYCAFIAPNSAPTWAFDRPFSWASRCAQSSFSNEVGSFDRGSTSATVTVPVAVVGDVMPNACSGVVAVVKP